MQTLELKLTTSKSGGHRYDFFVSGSPLLRLLPRSLREWAPRLGGEFQPIDSDTRDLLLLEAPGDLPSGRVALYVCPICGDYGCGVIGALVFREGATIIWSDFALESLEQSPKGIESLGPFKFIEADYRRAIAEAVYAPSHPM
jgi:hypothetical protein